LFDSLIGARMTVPAFLICEASALALGILAALAFCRGERRSAAYARAMALMPPLVALVIMMVNGNIGAGLAVAGTFALVRFRSAPGTADEITGIFFSVAIGLACGMGFVGYAVLLLALVAGPALLLRRFRFGEGSPAARMLKITIPENLNYETLFDDLFFRYTRRHELERVRTTNLGTLYELTYRIELVDPSRTREFIDALRCRNGNLNITCGYESERETL